MAKHSAEYYNKFLHNRWGEAEMYSTNIELVWDVEAEKWYAIRDGDTKDSKITYHFENFDDLIDQLDDNSIIWMSGNCAGAIQETYAPLVEMMKSLWKR